MGLARDIFGRGEAFVSKITGRVDRPLQKIREFRNRPNPAVTVTVDLLTTGVDIPDLEYIVFLRPVKSRILFEQILGRGTRKGEKFPDKSHFTVFDCFDGTLLAYFAQATGITAELPEGPSRPIREVIEDIWGNRDRDYNTRCLVKRLNRIEKQMAGEARALFATHIPDGDMGRFAGELPQAFARDFTATMKILRDPEFQSLLVSYPRPTRDFIVAAEYTDAVSSAWAVRDAEGSPLKPEDYLELFAKFVQDGQAEIEAIQVLLDRPRDWNAAALKELRAKLRYSRQHFDEERLRKAHEIRYRKPLVDIISMVKHAADQKQPLLTAAERVERAFATVTRGQRFSIDEQAWVGRIREVMLANLSIDREDFEEQGALAGAGGWGAARRVFGDRQLDALIHHLNEAVAA